MNDFVGYIDDHGVVFDGDFTYEGGVGPVGPRGPQGVPGPAGADGKDGKDGVDGKDGKDGTDGQDGADGADGADGYTPIKGVDYFTAAEITDIENDVRSSITIPTKTSDLTNDGTNQTGIEMAHFALANKNNAGLYIGTDPNDARVRIKAGGNSYQEFSLETKANRVTTLSSPNNNQYPTTKAVSDALPTTFTGTDGVNAGTSGLVPAPATTDENKFLKSDGTWTGGVVTSAAVTTIWKGTQAQYDAILVKDATTLYLIEEA